jgi:MoaA/NifB/PqqE/SkfB family radical SAM enzyme
MPTRWVVLHVTDRCQRSCQHCLRDPAAAPADLPVELAEQVLAAARTLHRSEHVALTGGEPSLHPRLPELLAAVVRQGYSWHLVTSGRGFQRVLDLLDGEPALRKALTAIDVSVDGATAATHDAIRGEGSWREAMRAIAAVRARGIPLAVQMTVNALNVGDLEQVGLLASQVGAGRAAFHMTQATGSRADARLHLSRRAWRDARDRVGRLGEALKLAVSGTELWEREQPFHACEPLRGELLHVDPAGRLNLCCQHSGIPGGERTVLADLSTTSLAEAHRRLLAEAHRFQADKLAAMEAGALGAWDLFPCNYCLRHFGMPHWNDEGSAGARALGARGGRSGE